MPRAGVTGRELADLLRAEGAEPIVAPVLGFAGPADRGPLDAALVELAAGSFDWLVLTSSTARYAIPAVLVPATTKVAAVGERSAAALRAHGLSVSFVPHVESAEGIVDEWPDRRPGVRVLLPQSELAEDRAKEGLAALGLDVTSVVAYQPMPSPLPGSVRDDLRAGGFDGVLVTSGSIAARLADEVGTLPSRTHVIAIGPRTAREATEYGLAVAGIAAERRPEQLIEALIASFETERERIA